MSDLTPNVVVVDSEEVTTTTTLADESRGICWALHDFEAENEDELSFFAGEQIVITQRDELYGDGWFEGRNTKGEIGLFPQSYTSVEPPSPLPDGTQSPKHDHDDDDDNDDGTSTPEPNLTRNNDQVQQALDKLQGGSTMVAQQHVDHDEAKSVQSVDDDAMSQITKDDGSDDDEAALGPSPSKGGMGTAHRAALAAKAAENAEKAAREERERAERRRREDEEAYERARSEGLVEGLQLSSESESEDELPPLPAGMQTTVGRSPTETQSPASLAVQESSTTSMVNGSLPADATLPTTVIGGESEENRPRTDTLSSTYAESTYSDQSGPSAPVPAIISDVGEANQAGPNPAAAAPSTADADPPATEAENETPKTNGDTGMLESITSSPAAATAAAVGAGIVGAATAAAAGLGIATQSKAPEESLESPELPKETQPAMTGSSMPAPESVTAIPAAIVTAPTPVLPSAESPPVDSTSAGLADPARPTAQAAGARSIPSPIKTAHHLQQSPMPSPTQSQSSSRVVSTPLTSSTGATDLSPRRDLPSDPATWSVEDVVEWARTKGFDSLTIGKFQEHEISGDVLLEMDVAMLKEIDLVAFGRRVHIYNAIKELRARSRLRPMTMISPAMSGYEPDSPGNASYAASPSGMSFVSPVMQYNSSMQYPQSSAGSHGEDLHGLGLEDNDSSRPSSSHARSVTGAVTPQRSKSALGGSPIATGAALAATGVAAAAAGAAIQSSHARSSIGTESNHVPEPLAETAIPEEDDETETAAPSAKSTPILAQLASSKSSVRKNSTTKGSKSDSSAPSSPNLSKRKDSASFFGVPVGRTRKPPPRVPSAILTESDGRVARTNAANRNSRLLNQSKRSTRLFGSFGGGGSGSEKHVGIEGGSRRTSGVTLSSGRDAPSSMSPRTVDQATQEMLVEESQAVKEGENLMEKIGKADYSGWMQKKGEKYNSWKQRFFVLKGVHLYYLKSESEQRVKGFVNLRGYRVISDPNIHPGFFGFKIVHDTGRDHYFSAAEQVTVRSWMKEIMKSTIDRDYSEAALSSCDIETMPLSVAQAMTPRPRPPSPTERARVQRERYAGSNPNTLSPKDAQILMEFSPTQTATGSMSSAPKAMRRSSSTFSANTFIKSKTPSQPDSPVTATPPAPIFPSRTSKAPSRSGKTPSVATDNELLTWVNAHLPTTTTKAVDLSTSLRSGEVIVRLVENVSGKDSGISDDDFAKYTAPRVPGQMFDAAYFDTIFNVFDYLSPIVSTDDVSMDDMLSGNEPQLSILMRRIRDKFPQ